MIDFTLSEGQREWQTKARNFARTEIAPFVQRLEDDLPFRLQLFKRMGMSGYFNLALAADSLSYLLALKEIARVDAGIAVAMAVTNMVADAIQRLGSPQQKEKYLAPIARGEGVPFSFALTEKNAGSDVKKIETEAVKDDSGDFILTGEKKFITNGDIAGVTIVMAKSAFEGSSAAGTAVTAFLVDKGFPGFSVVKKEQKLGLLTANLVTLKFDSCRIPASQVLGQQGRGLEIALQALDGGRLGVAAQALGIAESAFEAAKHFAMQRQQFDAPIVQQQAVAFKLADMRVKLSAGELLLFKAAWRRDNGLSYTREASEAKLFCSEAANAIADEALQIHGGCGYTKDYPVEKYFRDARVTTLYEGTSEIQRLIIARHLLKETEVSF